MKRRQRLNGGVANDLDRQKQPRGNDGDPSKNQ
jgi:hypothetical protein